MYVPASALFHSKIIFVTFVSVPFAGLNKLTTTSVSIIKFLMSEYVPIFPRLSIARTLQKYFPAVNIKNVELGKLL